MNIALSCLLVLAATVATNAEADPQYPYYGYGHPAAYPPMPHYGNGYAPEQSNYFRAGLPNPSFENQDPKQDGRVFLGTVTITLATTTSTSTVTTSTTCTTSARAISICSPSGRRRRGVGLNNSQKARGLFYNDEQEKIEAESIFTRSE
ncbi:uncharacterized protein LOC132088204 [Daphnia carinata]|uniref:uncharacterized protein LOC132088204 n=1 Tax=Daphnia carinata TaxID=120202 RepID=UPI0028691C6E|nr:uncharacterized protein LOC132088204 [Daphnia carinata]